MTRLNACPCTGYQLTILCACARRVRLYNKGDSISDEFKTAKLKREFRKMNELAQMIYWADVGREGSIYFEQLVQQKKLAESLKDAIPGDISTDKAQKMIEKAIEVQRKADADRSAKSRSKSSRAASASKPSYGASQRHYNNRRDRDQTRDRQRGRGNNSNRGQRNGPTKQRGKASSRSASASGAPSSNRA